MFVCIQNYSQNTVGTVFYDDTKTQEGYTLFTSFKKSYLINNCGQVINEWESNFPPGNAVYLLPNGNLLRAGREDGKSDITFGGMGGVVEIYNWGGDLIWSHSFNDNTQRQHHDIYPMPNGNILVLVAELWTKNDAIEAGRNPAKITEERLYNEKIIEVTPVGTNQVQIVWEWSIKDHVIQDFDNTKSNFGNISENPNRVDINYLNQGNGSANWLHINSIQYNEKRDQIVLSSRNLSEIWIIDHSTTTLEAATNSGGIYGKGGDLLYRWGNPQAYKIGDESNRKLFGQHYPHYIEEGLPDAGKLILFNNGDQRNPFYSEVFIMSLPETNGIFSYTPNTDFGPENPDYIYAQFDGTNNSNFYSRIVSGAQKLPNGNILICEGAKGNFFEIDSNEEIVWNYINPVNNNTGNVFNQGENALNNLSFRALKYPLDYVAFTGKNLNPGNTIEGGTSSCSTLSTSSESVSNISIYPNPSETGEFTINNQNDVLEITVYNLLGKKIYQTKNTKSIDLKEHSSGIYLARILTNSGAITKKLIKTN